ncbi:MAG: DUF2917 domain-containing protein [Deltaproteobacteria bacterium]|nr:MAG: DUF2917 domain-containing protein [Deltaproteobacteria bacterium]
MQLLLAKGEILSLDNHRTTVVYCLDGLLWLTRPGDSRDHLLRPGQQFSLKTSARVVVMALETGRLELRSAAGNHALRLFRLPSVTAR